MSIFVNVSISKIMHTPIKAGEHILIVEPWVGQLLQMARYCYCHFNKIIKEPGTTFQSPARSRRHIRNVCHLIH